MLPWMMLPFSGQLNWTRLLFSPTHGTDPEVGAQMVEASAQAYLSFGTHKGKGKGKAHGKGKGRYPGRPSHLEDRRRRLKELEAKKPNVQCLLPARLHKIRHVQVVWRHANNMPTKRIRLECVSSSTNTVTILIHPHIWLVTTCLCRQKEPNRYP